MRSFRLHCLLIFPALIAATVSSSAESAALSLLPERVALSGPEATHGLLVMQVGGGEMIGEVASAEITSSDPSIVAVENGRLIAKGNGNAIITATANGNMATAEVHVTEFDQPWKWSFRNHVLPVLSRQGCNSGGCHGALAGKGGFRLSLGGYDPNSDFKTITREARGRRIELAAPAHSLLLTKPTTAVKHKGGVRIEPGTKEYQVLAEWISQGATAPHAADAQLEIIETFPDVALLQKGQSQQILVRAKYSDGREEDVTSWAKFTSSDETVARVDEHGKVQVVGHGEGAVTAWFSSRLVTSRITSPFPNSIPPEEFARQPRANFIDDFVLPQLQRLQLPPSPLASDQTFVRRAYLDTLGRLPTPGEASRFVADTSIDKYARLADHLLNRQEFADYWAYKWSDVLLVNGNLLRPDAVNAYYQWIHDKVVQNTPWDAFVRELVTSRGDSFTNGATNFFAVHQDPETAAENVSQAFLSLSINCAKCHNHPLEKWTNDQYYAFANLFSRVKAKGWGGEPRSGDGKRTLFVETSGELIQPRTGKPQPPAPLDAKPIDPGDTGDRRVYLAEWLTSPENSFFSKAITNRVWANFFGIGIVEPVDDLRVSNPPSNPKLLDAAAAYLVANRFDLKTLMRAILTSTTYRRSSETLPGNSGDLRYYSRYYPRRLMAEVLHDAVATVTDVPSDFSWIDFPGGDRQKTDLYPLGTRAIQLYDSAVSSYFLKTFGRNERAITCECERSNEPSMVQVLHISNGDTIDQKLRAKEGRISSWIQSERLDAEIIQRATMHTLSRPPTNREMAQFSALLADAETGADGRREAIEDMLWALMSSREFLFNH